MGKVFFLLVCCLFVSLNAFGQAIEISQDEYFKIYRESFERFQSTPVRRRVMKETYFREGKPQGSTETITENISPDRYRRAVTETSGNKTEKLDFIQIGEKFYCKKNKGAWKLGENCDENSGLSGLSSVASREFSLETVVESGKSLKLYRQYIVSKIADETGKETLLYWETKFWIDDKGNLLRSENESGLKESRKIRRRSVTVYEYNPKNLKIEAPIKS